MPELRRGGQPSRSMRLLGAERIEMFARPEDMLDVVDVLRAVGGGLDAAALEHISCSALADEIDRMRGMIARVRNFPNHPGGHPADLSDDADDAASWRHGWICAVEAMQDALTANDQGKGRE